MAFDPTIPSGHGPLSSADMRNQLNALKTLIDAQAATIQVQQTAIATLQSNLTDLQDYVNDYVANHP